MEQLWNSENSYRYSRLGEHVSQLVDWAFSRLHWLPLSTVCSLCPCLLSPLVLTSWHSTVEVRWQLHFTKECSDVVKCAMSFKGVCHMWAHALQMMTFLVLVRNELVMTEPLFWFWPWTSQKLIIDKEKLSSFVWLNSQLFCAPFPIPKLSTYLLMEVVWRNGASAAAIALSFIQGQCSLPGTIFTSTCTERSHQRKT